MAVRSCPEGQLGLLRDTIGRRIAYQWDLSLSSTLACWFEHHEVHRPEDMVEIILTSYWRQIHSRPIDFEGQIRDIKQHPRKSWSELDFPELFKLFEKP